MGRVLERRIPGSGRGFLVSGRQESLILKRRVYVRRDAVGVVRHVVPGELLLQELLFCRGRAARASADASVAQCDESPPLCHERALVPAPEDYAPGPGLSGMSDRSPGGHRQEIRVLTVRHCPVLGISPINVRACRGLPCRVLVFHKCP